MVIEEKKKGKEQMKWSNIKAKVKAKAKEVKAKAKSIKAKVKGKVKK